MPRVEALLARIIPQLKGLLPDAKVEHIGATAVPGSVTKGDVDVLVQVAPAAFPTAVTVLRDQFGIRQSDNWTHGFASFGDDVGYDLPLGIQLVASGSENDFLIYLRDFLNSNPEAVAEYNQLKLRHAPEGPDGYWKAKNAFFSKISAARPR